jgi:Right handed beta helix region/Bacterial pre-peptidase C-terminal domain/Chondroitinase B
MLTDFSASSASTSVSAPTVASAIPEYGLPSGRGTTIQSATNTSLQTALNVGNLASWAGGSLYNGAVSQTDTQDFYKFEVAASATFNVLLSNFSANLELQLLDAQGAALPNWTNADAAKAKALTGSALAPGTYYVKVSASTPTVASDYSLNLFNGNVYYVASGGSDRSVGSLTSPFQTIQHAADIAKAGDTILMRDGTYYERSIQIRNSGTADRPITLAAVAGEKVAVDHGLRVTEWIADGTTGVYKGKLILPNPNIDQVRKTVRVVVADQSLIAVGKRFDMTEGTFWVDTANGDVYVWAKQGINPSTKETLIINRRISDVAFDREVNPPAEAPIQTGILAVNTVNYVVLDGFVSRAGDIAIWAANLDQSTPRSKGLTVRNMEIKYAWQLAVQMDHWDGALIENNNIHSNSQENIPRGQILWHHAIIGYNTSNVIVQNNRIHNNHGEGVGPFVNSEKWQILNNIVYDNWSVNIYIDTNLGDVTVDGNLVYNTGKYSGDERDIADGIRIANEGADVPGVGLSPGIYNVKVTNNIVFGTSAGINYFPYFDGPSYLMDSLIANNTIGPIIDVGNGANAIFIKRATNVRIANNITSNRIVLRRGFGEVGIVAENNLVKDASSIITIGNSIKVNGTLYGDPQYAVGTGFKAENYQVKASSIAVNAGVNLSAAVPTDYMGKQRPATAAYTLGAFQAAAAPVTAAETATTTPAIVPPNPVRLLAPSDSPSTLAAPVTVPTAALDLSLPAELLLESTATIATVAVQLDSSEPIEPIDTVSLDSTLAELLAIATTQFDSSEPIAMVITATEPDPVMGGTPTLAELLV